MDAVIRMGWQAASATYNPRNFASLSDQPGLTVPSKFFRSLMLWLFVALQTMTPFIHAHAGAVQLNHGGLLHLYQGVHGDAACHAVAAHEHGVEVAVAQGMPVRSSGQGAVSEASPGIASQTLFPAGLANRPGAGLPAPPSFYPRPDHALPLALAPPVA